MGSLELRPPMVRYCGGWMLPMFFLAGIFSSFGGDVCAHRRSTLLPSMSSSSAAGRVIRLASVTSFGRALPRELLTAASRGPWPGLALARSGRQFLCSLPRHPHGFSAAASCAWSQWLCGLWLHRSLVLSLYLRFVLLVLPWPGRSRRRRSVSAVGVGWSVLDGGLDRALLAVFGCGSHIGLHGMAGLPKSSSAACSGLFLHKDK